MQKRKKLSPKHKIYLGLLALLSVFFLLDLKLQQLLLTFSRQEINQIALNAAADAVAAALEKTDGDFVTLHSKGGSEISVVQTNMETVNGFMNTVTKELTKAVDSLDGAKVSLPVGTLTGSAFFNGRGPLLSCQLVPFGEITIRTESHFESCGINQTRHQILLHVELNISALTSFRSEAVTAANDYILSDTILVGSVPESYTYILMEDSRLISDAPE